MVLVNYKDVGKERDLIIEMKNQLNFEVENKNLEISSLKEKMFFEVNKIILIFF